MAATATAPRLQTLYREGIQDQLKEQLGLDNIMQVPRFEKIVLNMGVGEAVAQAKLLDGAVTDLTTIAGQRPVITRAKKSIANFKIREGNPIGAKVTLRGVRMWEFLDRLINLAIPRIRDFPGLVAPLLRRERQLLVRGHRAAHLPRGRLRLHRRHQRHGHHHRHNRNHRRGGPGAARGLLVSIPSRGTVTQWQKRHLSKSNSERRSSRYGLTPAADAAAGPEPCTASSGSVECVCGSWPTPARSPA